MVEYFRALTITKFICALVLIIACGITTKRIFFTSKSTFAYTLLGFTAGYSVY